MKASCGKVRIGAMTILATVAFAILAFTSLIAPRVVQAQLPHPVHLYQPPPHAFPITGGAPLDLQPPAPTPPSQPATDEPAITSGVWTPLNNQPTTFYPGSEFLLTDGRVLVQDANLTAVGWWTLTPDNTGSYLNGTWNQVASPSDCANGYPGASADTVYSPTYYASAVLPDGRFVMIGGEYNYNYDYVSNRGTGEVWSDQGAIYDPVANSWTCIAAPSGWAEIGDSESVVLPNGTFMLAHPQDDQVAALNVSTNPPTFGTPFTPTGKTADTTSGITCFGVQAPCNDEEGWELLPNGTVETLEVWNSNDGTKTPALTYNSTTKAWSSAWNTPDPLVLISKGSLYYFEIGPALLRPDGTVFAEGATGFNDIYNTGTATWSSGPSFPTIMDTYSSGSCTITNVTEQLVAADAPSALLTDGNVLMTVSPVDSQAACNWVPPSEFFEFDGTNLTQVAEPTYAPDVPAYDGRLLVLPTGQVMYDNEYNYVEIYTPTGTANPSWAPTITNSPAVVLPGGTNYQLTGTQFNGLSQAVSYGDDYQGATNYPLVQITNNTTGHVLYARTHDHSTMAVATGSTSVSTKFDVPAGIEGGPSTLVVIANGIQSSSVAVDVSVPTPTATATATATPTATATATATGGSSTATVTPTGGTPTVTPTPTATATATATATMTRTATATTTATATATATPTPVPVTLKIKPTALKFPKTAVGTPSKPKAVKVSNPKGSKKHPGSPVLIEMVSDTPGIFMQNNNCPATLAANAFCTISVTFTPSEAAKQTGMLTITDNAHGVTQTVSLSGTGK